jgi:hypothetical protein
MKDDSVAARAVRVSLPASVAADIGSLKKAVGSVLDRLGCPACCSGHDIRFELQRHLVLSEKFKETARLGPVARVAVAEQAPRAVRVGVRPEAVAEIEAVHDLIDRIAELSGHPACATGCDMFFEMERILVMDERLDLREEVAALG